MKRAINLLLVFVMVLLLGLQMPVTYAAGISKSEAVEVFADENHVYGTISKGGDKDWYTITTGEEQAYYVFTIHNESGTENIHLRVYDEKEKELLDVGNYTGAGEETAGVIYLKPNTTYYLRVGFNSSGKGNYYFFVKKLLDQVGDDKETAATMQLNSQVVSCIEGPGDKDYFVFTTGDTDQDYRIVYNNISGTENGHVVIYTARDEEIINMGYYTGAGGYHEDVISLRANTTYYAVAYMNKSGYGEYSFAISQCLNGHTYSGIWEVTQEPTCEDYGMRIQRCSLCGEVLEEQYVDPKGHKESQSWVITKAPTCIEVGEQVKYCVYCNSPMAYETLDSKEHTYGEWVQVREASWKALGKSERCCDLCGAIDVQRDWSKAWILPAVIIGVIVLLVGIINYIKSFASSRR